MHLGVKKLPIKKQTLVSYEVMKRDKIEFDII